jgi:hypothetical protein
MAENKKIQTKDGKDNIAKKVSSSVSNPKIRKVAEDYMKLVGKTMTHPSMTYDVSPERGARIAKAYEEMKHNPNDPTVKKAYDALIKETKDQWDFIRNATGLKASKITPDMENPYPGGSKDVLKDIQENNHLWYFPTEQGYGSTEVKDHPLLQKVPVDGEEVPANDLFRIVHDYFGHGKEGHGFGPQGEENAWMTHKQMYSPEAQKALTSETRGQNSWVNFGPLGEQNRKDPSKTTYAEQKAGLLPDWALEEEPTTGREKYAEGGEVEEKFGRHLIHYSHHDEPLDILDPTKHGSGRAGAELRRGKIPGRTYYYEANGNPEDLITSGAKYRYVVKRPQKILNLAHEEAIPFLQKARDTTELEEMLIASGYEGYKNSLHPQIPDAVAIFTPQKPISVKPLKKYADGGMVDMPEGAEFAPEMPDTTMEPNRAPASMAVPSPTPAVTPTPSPTNKLNEPSMTEFTREYAPVWDISEPTPKKSQLSHQQVQDGILSGQYSFANGAQIPVFNPEGQLGTIPANQAEDAFANKNYRYATPSEITQHKYGGFGQQALATAESVGQGLFGPLAPMAEVATGLTTEEDIRGRREAGGAFQSGVESVAFAAPFLLTLGEWGAAKAGLTGIGKALQGAKAATKYTLPGVIDTAVASRIPITEATTFFPFVGKTAMRGAFENILGQASTELTQKFLDNPDQTAETAATAIGMAGLFGLGMGGGLGAIFGGALPFVTTKALPFAKKTFNKVLGRAEEAAEEIVLPPEPVRPRTQEEIQEEIDLAKIEDQLDNFERELEKAGTSPESLAVRPVPEAPGVPKVEPGMPEVKVEAPEVKVPGEVKAPEPSTIQTHPDTPQGVSPEKTPDSGIIVEPQDVQNFEKGKTETIIKYDPNIDEKQKKSFLAGLREVKPDIEKIDNIWKRLVRSRYPNAEQPIGLTVLNPNAQNLEQQASKTLFGEKIRKNIDYIFRAINDELVRIVGTPAPVSAIDTGEKMTEKLEKALGLIERSNKNAYDIIREVQKELPLNDKVKNSLIQQAQQKFDSLEIDDKEVNAQLEYFLNNLKLKKNLDGLKALRTQLGKRTETGSLDSNAKGFLYELQNIITKGESEVMDSFINTAATPELALRYLRIKGLREEANANFSKYSEKYKKLFEALNLGEAKFFTDYGRILSETSPEDIVKGIERASYKDKKWIKQNFRNEFEMFKRYVILKNLVKHNVKPDDLKPTNFFKALGKDFKEKELYFSPEEITRLNDAEYLFKSMPPNYNPSGTSSATSMQQLLLELMNPFGWKAVAAKELGAKAALKALTPTEKEIQQAIEKNKPKKFAEGGMVTGGMPVADTSSYPAPVNFQNYLSSPPEIQSSIKMAQAIIKGDQMLKNSVKSVFDPTSKYKIPAPSEKNIANLKKYVAKAQQDPESLLSMVENGSHPAVPEFGSPFAQMVTRATNYLETVQPKQPKASPMDTALPRPKGAHDDMYNHVLKIVEQPLYIMDKLKAGTMIPEEVNAFKTVYPKLYSDVCDQITNHLIDHKANNKQVPYRVKVGLSMFLGQPLDSTMTPQSLQAIQAANGKAAQQAQQGGGGPATPQGGRHNLSPLNNMANMTKTPGQRRVEELSTK